MTPQRADRRRTWTGWVAFPTVLAAVVVGGAQIATAADARAEQRAATQQRMRDAATVEQLDLTWIDAHLHDARAAQSAIGRAQVRAALTALTARVDAVVAATTGVQVEDGREALVADLDARTAAARTGIARGAVVPSRAAVAEVEAAGAAVVASAQTRQTAEDARVAAEHEATRVAAEQEAARAATATRTPRSAGVPAPACASTEDLDTRMRAAAAAAAAQHGLSVEWVASHACGSGSVSSGGIRILGCFTHGSDTIRISIGGGSATSYRGSADVVAMARNVALHESAHAVIDRTTGSYWVGDRTENVTDAYGALYLGLKMFPYGYNDADAAVARAIHDGSYAG